jgi:hypothetical protein
MGTSNFHNVNARNVYAVLMNYAQPVLDDEGNMEFLDFKTGGISVYAKLLKTIKKPTMVTVEDVFSMTGQGVKSVFSFGQRLGEIEGMLQTLEIGYVKVRPQVWQKLCKVEPKSKKAGVYAAVSKIYPTAPLTGPKGGLIDGRCDALGIAHYLRQTY